VKWLDRKKLLLKKNKDTKLTQSAFASLRQDLSNRFKLAVNFTSKLKNLLLRSKQLLMRLLAYIRKLLDFGVTLVTSLEGFFKAKAMLEQSLRESQPRQSLWRKRKKSMLR
jgi:hypothetical protein